MPDWAEGHGAVRRLNRRAPASAGAAVDAAASPAAGDTVPGAEADRLAAAAEQAATAAAAVRRRVDAWTGMTAARLPVTPPDERPALVRPAVRLLADLSRRYGQGLAQPSAPAGEAQAAEQPAERGSPRAVASPPAAVPRCVAGSSAARYGPPVGAAVPALPAPRRLEPQRAQAPLAARVLPVVPRRQLQPAAPLPLRAPLPQEARPPRQRFQAARVPPALRVRPAALEPCDRRPPVPARQARALAPQCPQPPHALLRRRPRGLRLLSQQREGRPASRSSPAAAAAVTAPPALAARAPSLRAPASCLWQPAFRRRCLRWAA